MKYFLLTVLLVIPVFSIAAAGQAELWEYWDQSNEENTSTIDHSPWQSILDEYRHRDKDDFSARFSYSRMIDDGAYAIIDEYIKTLENITVREYSRDEQFAYWVNMYNAVTVRLILDNYPVSSIRKISDPWDTKLLTVEGQDVSLNDIEHRILRPVWKDPRIHFVVNCASLGCPDLPAEALTAENTERSLELAAMNFINSKKGAVTSGKTLILSSIFDWYQSDFGENEKAMLEYLGKYIDIDAVASKVGSNIDNLRVKYKYDWDLNE